MKTPIVEHAIMARNFSDDIQNVLCGDWYFLPNEDILTAEQILSLKHNEGEKFIIFDANNKALYEGRMLGEINEYTRMIPLYAFGYTWGGVDIRFTGEGAGITYKKC